MQQMATKIEMLVTSLNHVQCAASIWNTQAQIHASLKRHLKTLEDCVSECAEAPDMPAAAALLIKIIEVSEEVSERMLWPLEAFCPQAGDCILSTLLNK